MTLAELITYLDEKTPYSYLAGSAEESYELAKKQSHPDPLIGEIIVAIAEGGECQSVQSVVVREKVVTSLGQIRLRFMADDAPVEGFRLVEGSIITIDAAFNDEALAQKQQQQ